jgi:hypothetical protein
MTAPDEDPAIASLLGDAARLAEAANEKLDEAPRYRRARAA